jgi:hypothetical protein
MPKEEIVDYGCYGNVSDLLSILKPVCDHQTKAFHDSSFKSLFGKLFDSLLKDERII